MTCERCGGPTTRVMYLGAPGRLCNDPGCSCLYGLAEYAVRFFPWNNDGEWCFVAYTGPWIVALFRWLIGSKT